MDLPTLIEDLKQFIVATVNQATAALSQELRAELASKADLRDGLRAVRQEIADVDLKLDTVLEVVASDINDHERRIRRLESRSNPA